MDFKFGRASRLIRKSEYSAVFGGRNTRVSDRYFTVLAIEKSSDTAATGNTAEARLGLAISKKRAKRAVDRNRIKRVIRESFRSNVKTIGGFDIVVMNRDAAVSSSSADLSESLRRLWQKLPVQARTNAARSKDKRHPDKQLRQKAQMRPENGEHTDKSVHPGGGNK